MVFKCKMCGGDVEPINNTNIGKCLYCKSIMTLPTSDNEKIINLYNRATDLRLDNEFDKAKEIYEEILKIDNNQVEAHWGLLLCKYGVEYVDDIRTKKKVPTCHRTIDSSILNDVEYRYIQKKAYGELLELYKKDAEYIDKVQKRILKISENEEPYDIFICYKETDENGNRTEDSVIAEDIYEELIKEGYKVFFSRITLEEKLGTEYEPYIYSALRSSKVMLVVGTSKENLESVWVKNEWSRYLEFMKKDKNKIMIPVYSKIDAYKLPNEFTKFQAQNIDKIGAMQDLIRGIKKIFNSKNSSNHDINNGVKKLRNGYYEVDVVKEKLPLWYQELTIFMMIALLIINVVNYLSARGWEVLDIVIIGIFTSFLSLAINLVGIILSFIDRSNFKKSRICFVIGLLLKIIAIFNFWKKWHFWYYILSTIIIDIILVIIL